MAGRLYVGTSGFGYPSWAPRFYPSGVRGAALLPAYAARLPAVELNGTFYRQPSTAQVGAWVAAVPARFRFVVKAQRGGAVRAMTGDPAATLAWLLPPYRGFGAHLGSVLLRVPDAVPRDDPALDRLLHAWPSDMPLALEFRHPSWEDDWVHQRLQAGGAALCITDLPERPEPPTIRLTGSFLYLRLRRDEYTPAELAAWAARVEPFLSSGSDVFVFFKHDPVGRGGELALDLLDRLA
jgi:uncharacterized protein YecE (DUF72 family)